MKVRELPIQDIHPYAKNPRDNRKAVESVARSVQEFGFQQPIVVDAEGVIIAGHTRYAAAKHLGLAKVPVVVADKLSPEQVKAYRLADNKTSELSSWVDDLLRAELQDLRELGIDMDTTGFDHSEIAALLNDDDASGSLREVTVQTPPKMAWVLIGIPTVRFGEISAHVETIAKVDGVRMETVVSDHGHDEQD